MRRSGSCWGRGMMIRHDAKIISVEILELNILIKAAVVIVAPITHQFHISKGKILIPEPNTPSIISNQPSNRLKSYRYRNNSCRGHDSHSRSSSPYTSKLSRSQKHPSILSSTFSLAFFVLPQILLPPQKNAKTINAQTENPISCSHL